MAAGPWQRLPDSTLHSKTRCATVCAACAMSAGVNPSVAATRSPTGTSSPDALRCRSHSRGRRALDRGPQPGRRAVDEGLAVDDDRRRRGDPPRAGPFGHISHPVLVPQVPNAGFHRRSPGSGLRRQTHQFVIIEFRAALDGLGCKQDSVKGAEGTTAGSSATTAAALAARVG